MMLYRLQKQHEGPIPHSARTEKDNFYIDLVPNSPLLEHKQK